MKRTLLYLLFAVSVSPIFATNYYVKKTGNDANTGLNWNNAFLEVYHAIDISTSGDSIFVASGTYTPLDTGRQATFYLQNGVALIGGFNGTEAPVNLGSRDLITNETVLSGDFNGDDSGFANNSENAYHVIAVITTVSASTVLDGFTIRGGNADGFYPFSSGGGIYNYANSFSVSIAAQYKNLIIKENYASTWGGGIYNSAAATSTSLTCVFDNVQITDNDVGNTGSAIYNTGIAGICSPQILNSKINGNNKFGSEICNYGVCNSGGGQCTPFFDKVTICGDYIRNVVNDCAGSGVGVPGMCTATYQNITIANGGMYNYQYLGTLTVNIVNTIMYQNPTPISNTNSPSVNISYSLIQGSNGSGGLWNTAFGTDGGSNIDTDPVFDDVSMCDPTLTTFSPALGTGNSSYGSNMGSYQGSGVIPSPVITTLLAPVPFGNVGVGFYSAEQTIQLKGMYLTDSLTITPPSGFEISMVSGAGFAGTPIKLAPSAGTVDTTDVYIRFVPGASQNYDDTVYLTSPGAETIKLAVFADGTMPNPTVNQSSAFMTFGFVNVGDSSTEQLITVSGSDLSNDLWVVAPNGFKVSLSASSGYQDSISISPDAGGNVVSTPVYVKFFPVTGGFRISDVVVKSIGATSLFVSVSGEGRASIFFVKSDATGNNDGSTWTNAYTRLADAIEAVNISGDTGITIYVAKGTYYPDLTDQSISFHIGIKMKIIGGFAGNESSFTQSDLDNRDLTVNETVMSGDLGGNDDDGLASRSDNAYTVLKIDVPGFMSVASVIDGFTLTGGNSDSGNGYGGCLMYSGSPATFRNMKFTRNIGELGGAIYFEGYTSNARDLVLENCEFYNNVAGEGGAVFCKNNNMTLSNSTFMNNEATEAYGGALYFNSTGMSNIRADINNTTFAYNPGVMGGGIFFGGWASSFTTHAYLTNTLVWGNGVTDNTYHGAAQVFVDPMQFAGATLTNCLVQNSGGSSNWDNANGTDNGNNLDDDPMFKDVTGNSNVLHSNSPAIGTGDVLYGNNIGSYQGSGESFNFVGTDELNDQKFAVFISPNPVSDQMHVFSPTPYKYLEIISAVGRVEKRFDYSTTGYYMLSELPKGSYFVRVQYADQTTSIRKLIKQ